MVEFILCAQMNTDLQQSFVKTKRQKLIKKQNNKNNEHFRSYVKILYDKAASNDSHQKDFIIIEEKKNERKSY